MSGQYLPIRDYAVIGDGRTVAHVGRNGSIDWLCLPDLDSASVFAGLVDDERGGRFALAPEDQHEVTRRYLPDTNVLETTFTTGRGAVRVTDALTLPGHDLTPLREVARRIEGLSGTVRLRWRVEPRFGYGARMTRIVRRGPHAVAVGGADALAVCAWDAGRVEVDRASIGGAFDVAEGRRALIALAAARAEPLVFPSRAAVEGRLDATVSFWRGWSAARTYDGPWKEAVLRSALALKLLVYAPSGAIAAAPTTSLPETIGGERNWDYRFCWIRDTAFTLEALLQLGCTDEAHAFFWWFMHATRLTRPKLQVLYRLDGGAHVPERTLPLSGYRGSRPVRAG
jgi:GH15 family glucan-1,4-alpha-glucosidase